MTEDPRAQRTADLGAQVVRAVWEGADLDRIPALYAAGHVRHEPGGDDGVGFDTVRQAVSRLHRIFPGHRQIWHLLLAEGNRCFRHWSITGIPHGHGHGHDASPGTHPVTLDAMSVYRFGADGLFAETWTTVDWFAFSGQLAGGAFQGDPRTFPDAIASPDDDPRNREVALAALTQVIGAGRTELIPDLYADGCVGHRNLAPPAIGHAGLREELAHLRAAIPEQELTVIGGAVVAAGEWVAAPWQATGVQAAPFLGLPSAGRRATWGGQSLFRLRDGKIVESWVLADLAGMLRQFGG